MIRTPATRAADGRGAEAVVDAGGSEAENPVRGRSVRAEPEGMGRSPSSPSPAAGATLRRLAIPLALLLSACANDRPRPLRPAEDLFDPNPGRRVQAVAEVRRLGAQEHVAALIEMLDDEDETVRLVAGTALRDLTGRAGPVPAYGTPQERRRAVEDWRRWASERPAPPAPPGAAAGSRR